MAKREIAIIEDEQAIRDNTIDFLNRQGYSVKGYASRPEALAAFSSKLPDLVILDIGLVDDVDGGFELCRELRSRSSTLPIIFLTARDSDFDSVAGLRLGADDYISKETSLPHLAARIAALFRRIEAMQQPQTPQQPLQRSDLRIDVDRLMAEWQGTPLHLTVTEFWILHALVRHPGHVRSRDKLMEEAHIYVDSSSVSTHIKRIRRKFLEVDPEFTHIDTVYGAGYRWKP
ncbi:MAG: proteobacterial dedicated sortase system response regulator [Candidatus Thiodiazotropha sp. (ex Ctena orbiculata)]|nr:proteobacterial dedicated sortase system response regulator [Candidatus Thiodiazotropha taylori]